jgi:hypothetical protein
MDSDNQSAADAAAELNPDSVPDQVDPAIVAQKMAAGLTKDQAIEVCLAQIANDKAAKKEAKSKK